MRGLPKVSVGHEINRDRSEDWTDYDVSDWREGWEHWVKGDGYLELEA